LPEAAAVEYSLPPAPRSLCCYRSLVVTQPFPDAPDDAVHVCTAVGPAFTTPQVVVTKLLPVTGDAALHDPLAIAVGPVTTGAGHVVEVKLLPELRYGRASRYRSGSCGISGGQSSSVQLFPELAIAGVQLVTGTFVVTTGAGR
jgi:hypothetical protein